MEKIKKIAPVLSCIASVVLVIAAVMTALYLFFAAQVTASIQENLDPIKEELRTALHADYVESDIYKENVNYNLPWQENYHAFVTVRVPDLKRYSHEEILSVLSNGAERSPYVAGYNWEKVSFALESRTVTDSVTGSTHPVIVTVSDGILKYCLTVDKLNDCNEIYEGDAQTILHPSGMTQMMGICIWTAVIAFALTVLCMKLAGEPKTTQTAILAMALSAVVVIAGIAMTVISAQGEPARLYDKAIALENSGETEEACAIFKALGSYQDSSSHTYTLNYARAQALEAAGDSVHAYALYASMGSYSDSREKAQALLETLPYAQILQAEKGDRVTFGTYEQDGDLSNGQEDISWIVLSNMGGDVYLLSEKVLDAQPFNTENTEECTLDDWLKNDFANAAFSAEDKEVLSRINLMPEIDLDHYRMVDDGVLKAHYTAYAQSLDPERGSASGLMWWVTDAALADTEDMIKAPVVWASGEHGMHNCAVKKTVGVRPVIWLFADETTLPDEPVFAGNGPTDYDRDDGLEPGYKRAVCRQCGGDGKTHDWGTEMHGEGYTCSKCGGTGYTVYKDED